MLFSKISRLIFDMLQSYYNEADGKHIQSTLILSYQSAGDIARWHLFCLQMIFSHYWEAFIKLLNSVI